jgi:hypothetical protein
MSHDRADDGLPLAGREGREDVSIRNHPYQSVVGIDDRQMTHVSDVHRLAREQHQVPRVQGDDFAGHVFGDGGRRLQDGIHDHA